MQPQQIQDISKIKTFGPIGPKYQVGAPIQELEDGDWLMEVTVIETGEKAKYRLTNINKDPEAK